MNSEDEGAVKISVRERPIIEDYGNFEDSVVAYHSLNNNIIAVKERSYEFDYAFGPDIGQQELYEELVRPLVQKTLQGYFCSALAYGQTGTGKTFTMGLHAENFDGITVGVVPRALKDVFALSETEDRNSSPEISVSFVEIYNERVYDLLGNDTTEQINVKGFRFGGGIKKPIKNAEEGFTVLSQGSKGRRVRSTPMNPESSRSHAIFTIHICQSNELHTTISLLHLVDLAGSEGVRRTGHQGAALAEGVHINQGLLSIGKVLQALVCKRKVIPYRDSVLTSVLQDSLKSNSYLTLLACISPLQKDLSETVSTLNFAINAKNLKHKPQINVAPLQENKKYKPKTPQKSNQILPLRQSNSLKTPGALKRAFSNGNNVPLSAIKSNTFCTPNKRRRLDEKPINQTVFGMTPKEKLRFLSKPSLDLQVSNTPFDRRETLDSRSSILSMNVSTSTAIDAPATSVPVTNSYSPIVRRCAMEFETKIENKMMEMFDHFKEISQKQQQQKEQTNEAKIDKTLWPLIKQQVRKEILSLTVNVQTDSSKSQKSEQTHEEVVANDSSIDITTNETIIAGNVEPQFAQSSPLCEPLLQYNSTQFPLYDTMQPNLCLTSDDNSIFFQSSQIDNTVANHTVVAVPQKGRTRRRLSETMHQLSNQSIRPVRRSMRIERRNSMVTEATSPTEPRLAISVNNQKLRRESLRRSMRVEKTHAVTLATVTEEQYFKVPAVSKRNRKAVISNKTIASYFNVNTEPDKTKTKKQLTNAREKHEKAILDLLNTGNIKELQILPQIGVKTAFQIITQRTLHGKFKNFDQVSKLPTWRGKAWERFKTANSIS